MKQLLRVLLLCIVTANSFAQSGIKISELPAASGRGGGSLVPIVQSGVTKKISTDSLAKLGGWIIYYNDPVYIVKSWNGTDSVGDVFIRQEWFDSLIALHGGDGTPGNDNLDSVTRRGGTTTYSIGVNNNTGTISLFGPSTFGTVQLTLTTGEGGEIYVTDEAGLSTVYANNRITVSDSLKIKSGSVGYNKSSSDSAVFKALAMSPTGSLVKMNYWPGGGGGSGTTSDQVITATAAQTAFTFTSVPATPSDFSITRNGVLLEYTTDYTVSGNIITLTFSTVDAGDKINFHRIK